jgi:SAM-dependent methyltransferase
MSIPLDQHQAEIRENLDSWKRRPLLQQIYTDFYHRILGCIDTAIPGHIVEIGSGIGNLKTHLPSALTTDLFSNPWLDLVCDGYDLPFQDGSISHLVLFDVFHHLRAPNAFLKEARRALGKSGRLILFEPYISPGSFPAYGWFHHEAIGWSDSVDLADSLPRPRDYYAAQGNATRLFFRNEIPGWPMNWMVSRAEAFSCFHYLLSGGYSKPALYPRRCLRLFQKLDAALSFFPRLFGGRCLIVLTPSGPPATVAAA